jgi:hypothetical protein
MRRAVEVGFVLTLAAASAFAACSSDQSSRFRDSGAGGNATGSPQGSGGGTTLFTGMGGGTTIMPSGGAGGGSTGGMDGGVIVDPMPDPCMQNSDCGDGGAGYVCTVSNKCGKILGPCTTHTDCMGDSYCCSGVADGGPACRKDGVPDGVCIPGYVPPGNTACKGAVKIGVFSPSVQCEWPDRVMVPGTPPTFMQKLPPAPYDKHIQVMSWPMVADTPINSGSAAEIVFVAGNQTVGEAIGHNPQYFGVIQIVSGQTCELKATLGAVPLRMTASPALGDLDGDGTIDIVARRNDQGLVAYHWVGGQYVKYWEAMTEPPNVERAYDPGHPAWDQVWDGPSIHDINDDGKPEVILRQVAYNGQTGAIMHAGPVSVTVVWDGLIPVLGNLDGDNNVELVLPIANTHTALSDWMGGAWSQPVDNGTTATEFGQGTLASHFAYADFGSWNGTTFNHSVAALDGKPEIVAVNTFVDGVKNSVSMYSADAMGNWKQVMQVPTVWDPTIPPPDPMVKEELGGPPTIGDFDGDGLPEIAVAGGTRFRVFDLECRNGGAGCEAPFVKWSKLSQDGTSKQTGSSAFDFDGDGAVEVVYADECFLRVYDGKNGDVKYSAYRTSATWYEGPTIADVNKDQTTKIIVNSAETDAPRCPTGSTKGTPYVDPIHPGVRCFTNDDCPSMNCMAGFCRCTDSTQCGDPGLACVAPLAGTAGPNVCRAQNPNGGGANPLQHGIRVLNDRLNRWASSRSMWNQHAYSVTNINDDGSIPKTSDWLAKQNFKVKGLNNYRQNVQGTTGVDDLPDITGRLDQGTCQFNGSTITLTVNICNRGKRAVPASVPVTFYDGTSILCTGLTDGPVPTGTGCKPVQCTFPATTGLIGKTITIKANDDGKGQRGSVECNYDNNGDSIKITACPPPA